MHTYLAEPQNHPDNETGINWSGLLSTVTDQAGSLIVIALVIMLAMLGMAVLVYTVTRQRHVTRPD